MVKISVLDQSPISVGMTEQEALQATIDLAKHVETLGYERFWIAEHHDLYGLASCNPSVLISAIGAKTQSIRLGAGAVLLPYYKPFFVAETYNLLATLYPHRIDVGLGRAPGGSAEVSLALSDHYLEEVRKFPEKIDELHAFFQQNFPKDHQFAKIKPTPIPPTSPVIWMLGTSEKSGILAAEKGLNYAFGHFMTDNDGPSVVESYREKFKKYYPTKDPKVIVAIEVLCAETMEEAERLALSRQLWNLRQQSPEAEHRIPSPEEAEDYTYTKEDLQLIRQWKETSLIGDPKTVRKKFLKLHEKYQADEYMIVTITFDPMDKRKSYELFKEAIYEK